MTAKKSKRAAAAARVSEYGEEVAASICLRLAEGLPLHRICEHPEMPEHTTVLGWLLDDTHPFCSRYARARELQAERLVDELREIADDVSGDQEESGPGSAQIQLAKLRIDTRKFTAVRWGKKAERPRDSGRMRAGRVVVPARDVAVKKDEPKPEF